MTVARRRRPAPARAGGEKKRDATRRHLLATALALFQERGVDATTMRDIARAAKLALGAAYYHFPSKEALIFAFYDDNQRDADAAAARATGSPRERLGALFHGKLDSIRPHRAMLRSILHHLVDPADPLSAFSAQARAVRERSVAAFRAAIAELALPAEVVGLAGDALWLLHLACMLVYVNDASAEGHRTHGLVDDGLDLIVPLLPLLATPPGRMLCDRVLAALRRAGIGAGAAVG